MEINVNFCCHIMLCFWSSFRSIYLIISDNFAGHSLGHYEDGSVPAIGAGLGPEVVG